MELPGARRYDNKDAEGSSTEVEAMIVKKKQAPSSARMKLYCFGQVVLGIAAAWCVYIATETWVFSLSVSPYADRGALRKDLEAVRGDAFMLPPGDLSLQPGDLPGYTGWARPSYTLAGWFEIVHAPRTGLARSYWKTELICTHKKCLEGTALFDLRAYGPAVISGKATSKRNGKYDIFFYFPDPGRYTVEVVLTFSNTPSLDHFPIRNTEYPTYEGYMLPNFPLTIDVYPTTSDQVSAARVVEEMDEESGEETNGKGLRPCGFWDMVSPTPTAALEQGRWVPKRHIGRRDSKNQATWGISLEGYQAGLNSLGIQMDYEFHDCKLVPPSKVAAKLASKTKGRKVHVVFIGDSNMSRQLTPFEEYHGEDIKISNLHTHRGLPHRLPELEEGLKQIAAEKEVNEDVYILFNAGLHDIPLLCNNRFNKQSYKEISHLVEGSSCGEAYRDQLARLAQMIKDVEPKLAVFGSTTAGWLRWGNYGFGWDPQNPQLLPFDHHFAAYFNDIAYEEMDKAGIVVMDAYWLTAARPDHREVSSDQQIGKHLVHAGPEVYDVLARMFTTLISETNSVGVNRHQ